MNKNKQIIAIDIDDVIADNAKGFIEFSNKKWGTSFKKSDYTENWKELWDVDFDEAERRSIEFHESGIIFNFDHIANAKTVLANLKKRYKLVIITSRRVISKEFTYSWLEERFPKIFSKDDVYFSGIWDSLNDEKTISNTKYDIINRLGAHYLIDDHIKHCMSVSNYCKKVLLFGDYPWNKTINKLPINIIRVKNWNEVQRFFDEEEN